MPDDAATLLDIVLAGRRIARFVDGVDEAEFGTNEEKHWAVVSQLLVIGEAVGRLSESFCDARPHTPWRQISAMRNHLIHQYDKINWSFVWTTATGDVPTLIAELEPLVSDEADGD